MFTLYAENFSQKTFQEKKVCEQIVSHPGANFPLSFLTFYFFPQTSRKIEKRVGGAHEYEVDAKLIWLVFTFAFCLLD